MSGRVLVVLLPLLLPGGLSIAVAAGPTSTGIEVEVGVAGTPRAGCFNPVSLRLPAADLPAAGGRVAVAAEDPDGQWVQTPAVELRATPDGGAVARLLVKLGRRDGNLRVVTLPAATETAADSPAGPTPPIETVSLAGTVESTQELLLVVGTLSNADRAARLAAREDGSRARVLSLATGSSSGGMPLPAACGPAGLTYDAVDQVIVCGRAVAGGDSEQQLADLDEWVRLGGDLVLLAGMSLPDLVAASPTVVSWLPGRFDRLVPLRRGAAIETYARASRPLDRVAVDALQVPLFAAEPPLDGIVEVATGGRSTDPALVVRRAHGFGRITWVGLDLDDRPFQNWPGTDSLLLELLDREGQSAAAGRAGEVRRGGLDLAGQLRLAVDRYPGVAAIPFTVIALIGLLYVATLYPLDWWLASRDSRRSWVAWFSLPLIVGSFTLITWTTAERYRSPIGHLQTAGIVDVDQAASFLRAASFAGVWTAENTRFDIAATPAEPLQPTAARTAVSWFAAPGRSLGGPDALTPHPALAAAAYQFGPTAGLLDDVPQAAASSRLFTALWCGRGETLPIQSALDRTGQGTLRGTLDSRLPFPLEDCVLVHGGWLYAVGRLPPGGRFDLETGRGPRSLAASLTRRETVQDRSVPARWEADDRDIARILEVAGLHAAAGGPGYTGLESGRLGRLDLSRLLSLRRAILIGRGPAATRWQLADNTGQGVAPPAGTTLWRIVLPVAD